MITSLDVMLWGRRAGTLVSGPKGHETRICFYFDADYAADGVDFAPLRAPLQGVVASRGLPVYPEEGKEFGGLPSFIADSMPDRWGNMVFTEWARAHHLKQRDLSPLDRLAYIGRRGMGALEFVPPSDINLESPFKVEIAELAKLADQALIEAGKLHVKLSPDFTIENLFKVGTSAGGRRPKAVINCNFNSGECYSGQVAAPLDGFTPMIIKFDEHDTFPATRIEYSYYKMVVEAGVSMMPCRLLETNGGVHFLTERFDRSDEEKIHVQTLAAMNPYASSYEDLFDVAAKLDVSPGEFRQLFMRMAMNVACGNVDDHNKNFSFMLREGGHWQLAPSYDFTFAIDPSAPRYVNRHILTVNGKNDSINGGDLLTVASRYGVKDATAMVTRAVEVAEGYRTHAIEAGVSAEWIGLIEEVIAARCSRLRERL
ncbi:MAG: type II toxin-antitoxin system HipA family toxin [Candidatus Amulumruptor caecigallinarius]|nr:type II toxin-antitoxin system HipA family toxin [Candidatus Amulumruptor caecigallinarius]MCM1396581.1 type II toxin-antitoxin system HipA family toxin [Candidatus Amulumruptor caecigallinarius]MCM1453361.1 type II toxin-antitoxin system HipA family toxin [bacterium]